MRNKSKLFFGFIKRHKVWSVIVILILAGLVWYFVKNNQENVTYNTVPVIRGSISEIVSVTGNVKPLSAVDLAFEHGGRVANINVAVGDKVSVGQTLLSVANADLVASVDQAQANLKKALAQYQDIKNGTRAEEITLQESQVQKSTQDLAQAKISLINAIKDSYTQADDAVRNKIYSLFVSPGTIRSDLNFTTDSFFRTDIIDGKDVVSTNLVFWHNSLANLSAGSDLETYYNSAKSNLDTIKTLLDKCATVVGSLSSATANISQAQIDTLKANISLARTNISGTVDSLVASHNTYESATSALKISQDQLAIDQAGSTSDQILSAEASYEAAQAVVDSAQAELAKSVIKSPIDGVVTNIVPKLGEIVPATENVISVISYGSYEVEAFVPEADIAKVKNGDLASTTLDAYGSGVNFETTVIKIDPAATVIDGVPTYKVTLRFTDKDERVRSGMTANLDILTNQKNNVLIVPSRAITSKDDGSKYVSVINPNDASGVIQKEIITGIRGADGNVEVVSGINTEDNLVIPTAQ